MRLPLRRPLGSLGVLLILLGALAAACGGATKPRDLVHVLTWKGIVNPVMERYVDRGIDTAERSEARAVVLRLDTPGGLDSAMRDVIQRIEASRVPVIVYVSPAGGRAAPAGPPARARRRPDRGPPRPQGAERPRRLHPRLRRAARPQRRLGREGRARGRRR